MRNAAAGILVGLGAAGLVLATDLRFTVVSAAPVKAGTEVIAFVPPAPRPNAVDGSRFAQSIAVLRPGAWRCMVRNAIHDPCFGPVDATQVVCVQNPTKPAEAVLR